MCWPCASQDCCLQGRSYSPNTSGEHQSVWDFFFYCPYTKLSSKASTLEEAAGNSRALEIDFHCPNPETRDPSRQHSDDRLSVSIFFKKPSLILLCCSSKTRPFGASTSSPWRTIPGQKRFPLRSSHSFPDRKKLLLVNLLSFPAPRGWNQGLFSQRDFSLKGRRRGGKRKTRPGCARRSRHGLGVQISKELRFLIGHAKP